MVNFPIRILDCNVNWSCSFKFLFIICSAMVFASLGNPDHVVVSVSIDFFQTQKELPLFIADLMIILMLIEAIFMVIWEILHGRISLNLVLLPLLLNCLIRSRLELMPISLIISTKSSLIHLCFPAACSAAAIAHRNNFLFVST